MSGVRGPHAALFLRAVEGDRVGLDLRAPERRFEVFFQIFRRCLELRRQALAAETPGASGSEQLCRVDVALHLGERDRPLREASILMKDRVVRILPALVGEALLGRAVILGEAIPVAIAGPVDPGETRLDRRPQFGERRVVAGALRIEAGEHDEQRRGIDAAVVERERHLAQHRHLARPHLVQDFSGLGVGSVVVGLGLMGGKSPQRAARHVGVEPQHLQRGDEAVAAESRGVPGNAGIGKSPFRRVREQHVEVGHRAAQHLVEDIVRCLYRRDAPRGRLEGPPGGDHRLEERRGPDALRPIASDGDIDREPLLGRERQPIRGHALGQLGGRRIQNNRGPSHLLVETVVAQHELLGPRHLGEAGPAPGALEAPHLEQVGKIIAKGEAELKCNRPSAVIADAQSLIGRILPEKDRADDMQGVLFQNDPVVTVDIGIGQVDAQDGVVVAQVGAEQEWRHAVELQFEAGEEARVAAEQPVRSADRGADVAVAVEHGKAVAALQRPAWPGGRGRGRNVERRFQCQVDKRGHRLPHAVSRHGASCRFRWFWQALQARRSV